MRNTSISMSNHFVEYAAAQVASGRYASISEVVRDGLRLHEARQPRIDALNAAIDEGLASGPAVPFDPDAFLSEMREKHGLGRVAE